MKIIVRAHDVGKTDEKTLAKKIKELGFDGLQLAINKCIINETAQAGSMSDERLDEMAKAFSDEGLIIPLIGSYFNPVHSNKETVNKNILKFKDHLRFAHKFNTLYVGTETGSFNDDKWTYNPLNRTEEAYQEVKRIFTDIISYAKEVNSNICIEGADGHCIYQPKALKRLLDDIDNGHMFITVDVYNYLNEQNYSVEYQHQIIDECIDLFKDKIRIFHLKDFTMNEQPLKRVGLGEGMMDLKYIVKKAKENCPNAYLVFEGVPFESMTTSLAYIKELLK